METLQINIKEPQLYKDIQKIFKKDNISANDAIIMFFRWIQNQKSIPHAISMFNETTQKAIKDSYNKQGIVKCENEEDFFNKLGI